MLNRVGLIKMSKKFMEDKDLGALALLAEHLPDEYFPWTQNSIKPYSLLAVVNDIVVNQRKTVVEFGMGISTIVLSSIIKENHLDTKLISFEHDAQWIDIVKRYAPEIESNSYYLPVQEVSPYCYDVNKAKSILEGTVIDSVLVDGPPAYNWKRRRSRRGVIEIIKPFLNRDKFCVFLDDVNRPSEYKSIKQWGRSLESKTKIFNNCIGCVIKGDHYSFI